MLGNLRLLFESSPFRINFYNNADFFFDFQLDFSIFEQAKALYAYKANNDDEHSFSAGTVFEIVSKDSENWWSGRKRGESNVMLVPSNYCEEIWETPESLQTTVLWKEEKKNKSKKN